MRACIVEKVPFRLPGKGNRLVFAMLLLQRQGLSLLFLRKPDDHHEHKLIVAVENVAERVFEPADLSSFPLEDASDLAALAAKLEVLGENLNEREIERFFRRDED